MYNYFSFILELDIQKFSLLEHMYEVCRSEPQVVRKLVITTLALFQEQYRVMLNFFYTPRSLV